MNNSRIFPRGRRRVGPGRARKVWQSAARVKGRLSKTGTGCIHLTAPARSGNHPGCRGGRHPAARRPQRIPHRRQGHTRAAGPEARLYGRLEAGRYRRSGSHPGCRSGRHPAARRPQRIQHCRQGHARAAGPEARLYGRLEAGRYRRSGSHPGCRGGRHLAARRPQRIPHRRQGHTRAAGPEARLYGRLEAGRYGSGSHPGCRRGRHPAARLTGIPFPTFTAVLASAPVFALSAGIVVCSLTTRWSLPARNLRRNRAPRIGLFPGFISAGICPTSNARARLISSPSDSLIRCRLVKSPGSSGKDRPYWSTPTPPSGPSPGTKNSNCSRGIATKSRRCSTPVPAPAG